MAFDSFSAFIEMGGHGPYVWACYIAFFALSLATIIWSVQQRKNVMRVLQRRQNLAPTQKQGSTAASFARVDSSTD